MSEMIYCPYCGCKNNSKAKYCGKCGKYIKPFVDSAQGSNDLQTPNPSDDACDDTKGCPVCGTENRSSAVFCELCGYPMEKYEHDGKNDNGKEKIVICSDCGAKNYEGINVCGICGASLLEDNG